MSFEATAELPPTSRWTTAETIGALAGALILGAGFGDMGEAAGKLTGSAAVAARLKRSGELAGMGLGAVAGYLAGRRYDKIVKGRVAALRKAP